MEKGHVQFLGSDFGYHDASSAPILWDLFLSILSIQSSAENFENWRCVPMTSRVRPAAAALLLSSASQYRPDQPHICERE